MRLHYDFILLSVVGTIGYFLDFWRAFCDEKDAIFWNSEKYLKFIRFQTY